LSKVKRIESESYINLNIPGFQVKARNDSEKEYIANGYCVSLLQSVKIRTSDSDSPHDTASGEYNSSPSLTEVPKRKTSIMQEPKSSEASCQFLSLAQLTKEHSKILEPKSSEEGSQFSSLAQLANRHSKTMVPKSSKESSQFSPLVQFANKHSLLEADNQLSEERSFSSLAQLANRHGKVTKLHASDEDNNFSSLQKLANMHSGSEMQADGQPSPQVELKSQHQRVHRKDSITSLTDSLSQHLKVDENKVTGNGRHIMETKTAQKTGQIFCSQNGYVDFKTCLPAEQEPVSPVAQRCDDLATCCLQDSDIGIKSKRTKLFLASEKTDELARDCGTTSGFSSSVKVENSPVVRTPSEESNEMDWEIDLTNALISPGSKISKPKVTGCKLQEVEQEVPTDSSTVLETSELMLDFDLGSTILNLKLPNRKRKSPFGRTLCRKWKRLRTPYIPPQKQNLGKIVRFTFNTLSPDDKILEHLKRN
jgi:hypothetical protein